MRSPLPLCPQKEASETGGYFNSVRGSPVTARQALRWRFSRGQATIAPGRYLDVYGW
jgi:hypothetical protein